LYKLFLHKSLVTSQDELQSLPRNTLSLKENPKIYTLTSSFINNVTDEEDTGEEEDESFSSTETFIIQRRSGWIGNPGNHPLLPQEETEKIFSLVWHRQKGDRGLDGCYLRKCAACGTNSARSQAINRFVNNTDEPLEAMIDSIFQLLPEPDRPLKSASKRKLLTFSDGRQDAAFFASDYQRNHTELVYRQMIWQAFQEVKDSEGVASVTQVINQLKSIFLETSIFHPDRDSQRNYLSYFPQDSESLQNPRDCQEAALSRAKELLLREFALPFNRRLALEAFGFLASHLDFPDERLNDLVANQLAITNIEAGVFLTAITDIIRRAGIVSIEGASQYFPETGGIEGIRQHTLDVQGKSLKYLFLEKSEVESKNYQNSLSFLPKLKKDGQLSQNQNRLGWYYNKFFLEKLPPRQKLVWLFEELKNLRLLVPAKNGYQLNWLLLNLRESNQDWYQCNCCQQIFHIPNLAKIEKSQLNIKGCLAFKCLGVLQPYTQEKIEQRNEDHYQQYRVKHNLPLPLRSQEHTAQLSVTELEKRENRFRQGKINLLSSSTTLEIGVDIGELQIVVMRNFPPYVSNYQQRAGRAGRRTDGVSISLIYGQRRPHDRFYFEQPTRLIAGKNRIPQINPNNFEIQKRHIRAELLAAFLRKETGTGAEKIKMGDFLGFSTQDFSLVDQLSSEVLLRQLETWLKSESAIQLTQEWLQRLGTQQEVSKVLKQFQEVLKGFEKSQLDDWNQLAEVLADLEKDIQSTKDRHQRNKLQYKRDRLEEELEKIAKRRLHDELAQVSILPIYGFPIDVVRLLTGKSNEYKSNQGKHRLERDRRLGLGEYAPNQDIVVDDRVYRSVGIFGLNNLERQFYWVCKNCNYFEKSKQQKDSLEECPQCKNRPSAIERTMREYIVPKTFTTDWSALPKVTPYLKPQRQPTSQVFLAQDGENPQFISEPDLYELTHSQGGVFFLANQGPLAQGRGVKNRGFAICSSCGRDLSDTVIEQTINNKRSRSKKNASTNSNNTSATHNHPITGKPCSCVHYNYLHLGHEFRSDLLKIRFTRSIIGNRLLYEPVINVEQHQESFSKEKGSVSGFSFWLSLNYALLGAAAQVIDVPRSELDGLFRPTEEGNGLAEIVIYDNVPGGAGYSQRIAHSFQDVLKTTYDLVNSCSCDTSCYDCLRTYSNQMFHTELKRHVVVEFLKQNVGYN